MSAVLIDVTWKDRILSSHGISRMGSVFVGGGDGADVVVPFLPKDARIELVKIRESGVFVADPLRGDLYLRPGETARIGLKDNLVDLRVRQIERPASARGAAIFDLSSSEVMGLLLAVAVSALLGLYMNIYPPRELRSEEGRESEPIPRVKISFDRPIPRPKQAFNSPAAASPGASRPAQTRRRPTTPGNLLSAFGASGINDVLKKTFSEGNSLAGLAGSATGRAGQFQTGGLTQLRETGRGSDGKTVGIGGLGTQGRDSGKTGYAAGGIAKGSSVISVAGVEASFNEGMDREAIRRVIRDHLREIRNCYERELQRQPDLYGKVVLTWDIENGGRVSRATVKENSTGNARVGDCLIGALRGWKFPEPPRNQIGRISYPFIFSAQ